MSITRKLLGATLGMIAAPAAMAGVWALQGGTAHASTTYSVEASPSLNERAAPNTSAAIVGHLDYRASVSIICQTTGTSVDGSDIWDKLPGGQFVSDYWVSTPAVGQFSPGLTQCPPLIPAHGGGPVPTPGAPVVVTPTPSRATGRTISDNDGANGQCTYWALEEFHAYSGLWPNFTGADSNAGWWAGNAAANGWTVVSTPEKDSVVVFPPGVDGAFSYGHVAWVTGVHGNQITVSEMNYDANGGGWNRVDTRTLTPSSEVRYILAP
jgi:surface antigen